MASVGQQQAITKEWSHAKLVFISGGVKKDIRKAVNFLIIPVKMPDGDVWERLKWVLKHLKGTKYMKL